VKKLSARVAFIALVLLSALSWGGVRLAKKYNANNAPVSSQSRDADKPVVQVQSAERNQLSDNMVLPGLVRSDSVVAVTTYSEGIVSRCVVALGERVSKGQVLCKIENDNPSATYLPHNVESPVAGVVGEVHTSIGARVAKGDKIVTVLRSSKSKVELEVPVQDAARLRVGMPATWVLTRTDEAGTTQPTPTQMRISGVSPLPNMSTRTVKIELVADKGEPGLPGSMGRATFIFNKRAGFEVSEDAVKYRGATPFLRLVTESKVKWVPVSLGRSQQARTEILKGLKNGDVVVIESSKFLADGDEVITKSEQYAKK